MHTPFEIMIAAEHVRDQTLSALIRAANLRTQFEFTASEIYIMERANRQVEEAKLEYREWLRRNEENNEIYEREK